MSLYHCKDCGSPKADCECSDIRPLSEADIADMDNDCKSYRGDYGDYTQPVVTNARAALAKVQS